jgi:hypothetical protein
VSIGLAVRISLFIYYMNTANFIFALEAVPDVETPSTTNVLKSLEHLALTHGIDSIYQTCDTIEGLEDSLNALRYDDHHFKNYEIIYLVMPGEPNNICLNDYYYSLKEIAEVFEGRLNGKILHFANAKALDLTPEEAQYFLDVTRARAISGYGKWTDPVSSSPLDNVFFSLFEADDDVKAVVQELHRKQPVLCQLLDFRLYY